MSKVKCTKTELEHKLTKLLAFIDGETKKIDNGNIVNEITGKPRDYKSIVNEVGTDIRRILTNDKYPKNGFMRYWIWS